MKKITFLLLLTIFATSRSFAQKSDLEKANRYLKEKGEVIFTFKATSKAQFRELNEIINVSHKHVDENDLEVEAYADAKQFQKFLAYGLPFRVAKEDNELSAEWYANSNRAVNAWDTSWDAYPKYSEYVAKMQYWATNYPSLCTLQSIGTTALGRTLYVLKISDNAATDEGEPEFFYTSSMHGDEITGYPTMLHFIDELLTNYGSNTEITNLVNSKEIFICPLANPDGSYKTAGNDVFGAIAPTRANSVVSDLNRNYPDYIGGLHPDGNTFYSGETQAFMNFEATRHFVLAANYHGGAEVVNFPWDTAVGSQNVSQVNVHPHDSYFRHVSSEYASLAQAADALADGTPANYMVDVYGSGQPVGTTNGAIWYSIKGGRQDYNNVYNHNKEVTIEVSATKNPAAATLPNYWIRNRQSLLNFIKQAGYGLQGTVTDANGKPVHAKIYISSGSVSDPIATWVESSPTVGDYHKVQIAGTYSITFEAPGYTSQTISVTLTNNAETVLNVTMVPITTIPTAADATICTGQTAALTATGAGTISWYSSPTATTALGTGTSYTTPTLTATTSYWVDREVTPANVGLTVTGTAQTPANVKNKYMVFTCTEATKLKSVNITTSAAGHIMVELQNSSAAILESKVIQVASGNQDINLDFFLPVATGLRLVVREISGFNLTCLTTVTTYPKTSGNISITGNSGGNFYTFFNWKLAPIKSIRDEVIVTVKQNPTNGSISPTSKVVNSGAFTLTVNGTDFVNGESIVRWNGANRTTTFVSATQLTAAINAADITTAGTANVTVFNTCNSTTTSAQTFTIQQNCTAPVPNLGSLPNATGQCTATVTAPTATSNCYGQITGTTGSPLTYNTQGTYSITWTYNDGNGGITTQNQTVIVNDTTAPVPNLGSLSNVTGQCSATVGTTPTATDNCSGTITATTTSPLTYNTQGTFTVVWTYTDAKGNVSTQNQTVIVDDTIAPVANVTNLPNVTGQCSATVTAPTATDTCAGQITATTGSPLTYNTEGTFTIVWTYNDGNGNTSTQNQTVIVDDTIAPVANVTNLPNVTGQCSATVTAPTATDTCAGQITATTGSPLTYNTEGTFTIVWTYNDGHGNTSTQNQTVIVDDTVAPVANVTNLPNATGQCTATVTAPTATDTCSGQITATTASPLTYNTQGTFTIVWTYNDGHGNTSTQNQTVIVNDTTAPVPNVGTLATVTGQCSATVTAPTATDNCSGTITGTTPSPLTYNTEGTYTIVWTYTDAKGNTSTQNQTVIVDDTVAPVANVTNLPNVTGQCSATAIAPTATDTCSGQITATTANPLTYNTQGTFTIVWTYNDGHGNTSTQNQTVIVNDNTAPVPNVGTLATVTGQCSATVTAPTATDNCSGTITGTTPSPLTYNTQGTFTIVWTYTDAKGNSSTQNQTVIVDDTIAPVANVGTLSNITGQCSVTVSSVPTATDTCAGVITATTVSPLTYNTQGTFTIVWTYNDGNGNTSTQNQTVIIDDTIAPVANVTNLPNATGQCSVTVTAPTATDTCVGQITATTTSPLTYNTQGTFSITWTYNDGNGNTSTQTQTVIVDDTIAPVANVGSLANITGQCSVTVASVPTATDTCAGIITATTVSPLTYTNQGTYTIVWTYNDGNGNTSTQNQTVIVDDTIAPVADVTNLPTITGQCSAIVTAPKATDTCSGIITGTTTSPMSYNTQGTFTITWTYNDGNGNTSTQNQTVIVNDTTAPVPTLGSLPNVTGQCSATVATIPTANDNCSGTINATTTSPLTYNTQGTFTIVWTYTDAKGNFSTQNQTVIINDTTAPVANVTNLPNATGQCSVTVTAPTATDNCSGTITGTTTSPLTYNTQGTFTITWTYTDAKGNTSTQNQTVIVTNGGPIVTFYQDLDGDGFGNNNVTATGCVAPTGYVSNNTDCNDNAFSLTNTCSTIVNVKLFVEGYYTGSNHMTPVKANQGVGNSSVDVEDMIIELRNATTYALVATTLATLKTDGTAVCNFPTAPTGSFYIAVKGSNTIQTWSASPVTVGAAPISYDFSNAANKAYGSNMIQLAPGVFGIYSGDLNQDGNVDTIDFPLLENDSNNFASGAYSTDINGDGNVDTIDFPYLEGNSNNFVSAITPLN